MLRCIKAAITFFAFLSMAGCQSTPNHSGPTGEIKSSKWADSGAWASGNSTWAYQVLEVYNSNTMERLFKRGFIDLSMTVELPVGKYLVITNCYFNPRNGRDTELYARRGEHTIDVVANKLVTFDFIETTQSACTIAPRKV